MNQVRKSAENISREIESLLQEDEEVRRALEEYRSLQQDIDTHPYYHLLAASEQRRIARLIGESLWLIFRYLYGGEEASSDVSKASLDTLEADEFIARAVSLHSQKDDTNRVSIAEVEKWLIRRKALHLGFHEIQDLAFASALLDRPMPPFEARASGSRAKRNRKARRQVLTKYEKLDHPLKNRLETLRTEAREGRRFTPQILEVMMRDTLQNHLYGIIASNFAQFKSYREHFIQKAEIAHESFQREYDDLVSEYAECVVTQEVADGISIAPTTEEKDAFKDALRATDLGADYVLNRNTKLDGFRKQLRTKRRRLLLKIYVWLQVHEAIEQSNDPRKAIEPARITESQGTEGQLKDLCKAHDLLLSNPNLQSAETEEDWKSAFWEMDLKKDFGGYRRQIERLAHSCFETESKSGWPSRYRGYDNFSTLVHDLWKGSWIDHI